MPGNVCPRWRSWRIRSWPLPSGSPRSLRSRSKACWPANSKAVAMSPAVSTRVAVGGQHHPHHLRRDAVVFDQQDAQGADGAPRGRGGRGHFGRTAAARSSGSRTRNVAPLSRPALWASIRPPCISTRALLIASPRPRPPNCRVIERSACSKALKIRDSASRLDPDPAVVHLDDHVLLVRPAADAHAPAAGA